MWSLILYFLFGINNDPVIMQSNTNSGDDDPAYGDLGQVRPPRPKK